MLSHHMTSTQVLQREEEREAERLESLARVREEEEEE